jgi:dihydrofolate reductase
MGIVRVSAAMSLDGFIAGPNHEMDWVFEHGAGSDELVKELIETTGAILAGRGSYDVGRRSTRSETSAPFGGAWSGPQFVLTHNPPDDEGDESITFISGDIRSAVGTALDAAEGKNVLLFGGDVANQCLDAGLVDEFVLDLAPVLLGDGVRLGNRSYREIALEPIAIERSDGHASLRYRVVKTDPTKGT